VPPPRAVYNPGVSYYYGPPPTYPRPTQYTFYGPSSATQSYLVGTTSFYAPGSNRLVTTTYYVPYYGYSPGYYSGYYTPLYFRQ
jgi:hypothetical protein